MDLQAFGDLIATSLSDNSRNRKAGILIAKGKTIEETKQEVGMVIESIENIQIVKKLADKYEVEMPIVDSMYNILFNKLNPNQAIIELMNRQPKEED
jgi:glycerol-3-phosphate dehydrogenase (NAD(P)+)